MLTYRVHGITDDTDTCEFCGKIELRRVVMLAVLDDGEETGELIYAGTTCAARMISGSGARVSVTRVRDAATAADRIAVQAGRFADEFENVTLNQYIAANAVAYLNANGGDSAAALAAAKVGYVDLQSEIKAIRAGNLSETRFAGQLPVL